MEVILGRALSAELGLRLVPEGESLALIHFRTGERLATMPELSQRLQEARDRVSQAEQRARQLEEELARLRAHLPPTPGEASSAPKE